MRLFAYIVLATFIPIVAPILQATTKAGFLLASILKTLPFASCFYYNQLYQSTDFIFPSGARSCYEYH